MGKIIVFCADGTWNGPDQDDNDDRLPDPTNVFKLFCGLSGTLTADSVLEADEQEKVLHDASGPLQVAKYIHGVGDSRNPVRRLLGGAFGAGTIARIVRGYTFISRHYQDGDRIVLVGFSRGAYTARALAGLIASQGVLAPERTQDQTEAYRWGAMAWYRYRSQAMAGMRGFLTRLAEAVADLAAFRSQDRIGDADLVSVARIAAVAVWDTVGALGLPRYMDNERVDLFRFVDTRLSPKVERGFHAVALDEQRLDFTPTLWDAAPNVTQLLFPGAHADVGGGYPTLDKQSGLSDIALGWMVEQLAGIQVRFTEPVYDPFAPDARGTAHQPWTHPPFNLPDKSQPRRFTGSGIAEHPSIAERMAAAEVVAEPGERPTPYRPGNRP